MKWLRAPIEGVNLRWRQVALSFIRELFKRPGSTPAESDVGEVRFTRVCNHIAGRYVALRNRHSDHSLAVGRHVEQRPSAVFGVERVTGHGLILALLLVFAIGLCAPPSVKADPGQPPPPQPALTGQPNPDVYVCCGLGAISYLNAAEDAMLRTGVVRWHYAVEPGCEGLGSIKSIIEEAHALYTQEMGVTWIEDPFGPDDEASVFSCGVAWKSLCSGAVGCLAHSWPYHGRVDYDGPTLLSYAFRVSQVAVVTHEECHHILTCNEQYNIAAFSCIPGWHDFMNCGPDSRHYFETIEKERVKRIAYPPALTQTGYDRNASGWFIWACSFDTVRAKRLSVLVDRHDGKGRVWAGVYPAIKPDLKGCQGVGPTEGLTIEIGAAYFIKQESVISAFRWYNETCVKGSVGC